MVKTTVYLPEPLKRALEREAKRRQLSEAELIRQAVAAAVKAERPRPTPGLFSSGDSIAARDEEFLVGFGER